MSRIKVGVAMSGGVDSTSTALLLKDHYNITGFFMQLAQPDIDKQVERVRAVAEKIGVPLRIIDLRRPFENRILSYFSKSYQNGNTPNPCVICNREIKFGLFLDTILEAEMELMASGHYARIKKAQDCFHLLKGVDRTKDQSYFLSRLSQTQLSKLIFPLGERCKSDIYDFVEMHGFTTFRGSESQDVCFLEDSSVPEFLQKNLKSIPGSIVDKNGRVLGSHGGICNFTIGQRRGLGISDSTPYYVIRLDTATNSVVVGKQEDLFKNEISLADLHWITGTPPADDTFDVKIRNTHPGDPARLTRLDKDRFRLHFSKPQRAVTPGQFAVLYRNEEVIGSGVILT